MVLRLLRKTASLLSFSQCLVWLPLLLDLSGKDAFLALSLALTAYCGFEATFALVFRNTRLHFLGGLFTGLHLFAVPVILLLVLNLYSPSTARQSPQLRGVQIYDVLAHLPSVWEAVLRYSTPFFVLLEGVSTLLVIQSCGQFSRYLINERSESFQFLFLFTSATTYVAAAWSLVRSYPFVAIEPANSTLIGGSCVYIPGSSIVNGFAGVSISSVFFLSAIAFAMKRTSVVETSLMFAYVTLNVFLLIPTSLEDPVTYIQSFKTSDPPLPPLLLQSFSTIVSFLSRTFGQGLDIISAASSALPLPVLVGLVYRIAALYAASRVVIAIKRGRDDYEPSTRLSEEEPTGRTLTLLIQYSRPILVAVYTHLLLLENDGNQRFWRWFNVLLTTALWGVEILLTRDDADLDGVVRGFLKSKED